MRLGEVTLKDLCISHLLGHNLVDESKIPTELVEDIDFVDNLKQKELAKLVFSGKRPGLRKLLTEKRIILRYAARYGHVSVVKPFIRNGKLRDCRIVMYEAGYSKNVSLIALCTPKDWDASLLGAVRSGDREFIDYLISQGASNWGRAAAKAARYGNRDLVNFFVDKGARNWHMAMCEAARGGHQVLVEFFISKAKRWYWEINWSAWWNGGLCNAARGGHLEMVKFFIENGAKKFNSAMEAAAYGGSLPIIELLISKGASHWNLAMWQAVCGGHLHLVKFFIGKGADDWKVGLYIAERDGHKKIESYFNDLMKAA